MRKGIFLSSWRVASRSVGDSRPQRRDRCYNLNGLLQFFTRFHPLHLLWSAMAHYSRIIWATDAVFGLLLSRSDQRFKVSMTRFSQQCEFPRPYVVRAKPMAYCCSLSEFKCCIGQRFGHRKKNVSNRWLQKEVKYKRKKKRKGKGNERRKIAKFRRNRSFYSSENV